MIPADAGRPNAGAQDASQFIVDVDMSNFQQVVLEGSMQGPVLLDSWAPWCEPCKNLMPVLEKLAREYGGAFTLAKLNIEDNQEIATQLGIRSVPDVKLIVQGQLYDQFQGALPESQIREWLSQYLKAPEAAEATPEEKAQQALEAGDAATARGIYETLVREWPDHHDYQVDLAGALLVEGKPEEARTARQPAAGASRCRQGTRCPCATRFRRGGAQRRGSRRAGRARRQRGTLQAGPAASRRLPVRSRPGRPAGPMKSDRAYGDDVARKTLLRVFDALGLTTLDGGLPAQDVCVATEPRAYLP